MFVDATERSRQRRDPDPHEPRRSRPHHRQARPRDPGAAPGRARRRRGRGRPGHRRGRGVARRRSRDERPRPPRGRTRRSGARTARRGARRRGHATAPERFAPARGCSSATASSSSSRRAPTGSGWVVHFAGVDDRDAAEALRGTARAGRRARRRRPRARSVGARADRRRGPRPRRHRARARSRRCRRTRRTTCSCSTAARWCRWCSWSSTQPGVVVVDLPDGLLDSDEPVRRCGSTSSRSSPSTSPAARGLARRPGARARACSTCACTIRASHATDVHRAVDDAPFGGGAGDGDDAGAAVRGGRGGAAAAARCSCCRRAARASTRRAARELAAGAGFSLLCGRYEGVDQRVADHCCDGELSVGDYVLAGGEAAALVVIEAVDAAGARA